ncbi:hypothetical protein ACS0TY_017610 [Phlomoides rotata]
MKVFEMLEADAGFLTHNTVVFVCEILDCCPCFDFSDLELICDINARDHTGQTTLHWSAVRGITPYRISSKTMVTTLSLTFYNKHFFTFYCISECCIAKSKKKESFGPPPLPATIQLIFLSPLSIFLVGDIRPDCSGFPMPPSLVAMTTPPRRFSIGGLCIYLIGCICADRREFCDQRSARSPPHHRDTLIGSCPARNYVFSFSNRAPVPMEISPMVLIFCSNFADWLRFLTPSNRAPVPMEISPMVLIFCSNFADWLRFLTRGVDISRNEAQDDDMGIKMDFLKILMIWTQDPERSQTSKGGLHQISWFQFLPNEFDFNTLPDKSVKVDPKDAATSAVLSAHLHLQKKGFLIVWTNSFVGPWDPSQVASQLGAFPAYWLPLRASSPAPFLGLFFLCFCFLVDSIQPLKCYRLVQRLSVPSSDPAPSRFGFPIGVYAAHGGPLALSSGFPLSLIDCCPPQITSSGKPAGLR